MSKKRSAGCKALLLGPSRAELHANWPDYRAPVFTGASSPEWPRRSCPRAPRELARAARHHHQPRDRPRTEELAGDHARRGETISLNWRLIQRRRRIVVDYLIIHRTHAPAADEPFRALLETGRGGLSRLSAGREVAEEEPGISDGKQGSVYGLAGVAGRKASRGPQASPGAAAVGAAGIGRDQDERRGRLLEDLELRLGEDVFAVGAFAGRHALVEVIDRGRLVAHELTLHAGEEPCLAVLSLVFLGIGSRRRRRDNRLR